jgi:hypothetical protein
VYAGDAAFFGKRDSGTGRFDRKFVILVCSGAKTEYSSGLWVYSDKKCVDTVQYASRPRFSHQRDSLFLCQAIIGLSFTAIHFRLSKDALSLTSSYRH